MKKFREDCEVLLREYLRLTYEGKTGEQALEVMDASDESFIEAATLFFGTWAKEN